MTIMKKVVTIVGIGRVGLPLALVLANYGYLVYGIGRDQKKIDQLLKGKMPFIEAGSEILKKHVGKKFVPSTSYESISKSDTVILTLGTPIDENMNPVLDQIDDALGKMIPFFSNACNMGINY